MAKYTDAIRNVIIAAFNAGDQPTEAQFTNFITRVQEGIEEHDHDGTGDGDGITFPGLILKHTNAITALDVQCFDDGGAESRIFLSKSDDDAIDTMAETDDGDWLGLIGFRGVGSGLGWSYGAYMYAIQRGAAGVGNVDTDLIFLTATTTGTNANHLVLEGGGITVGINVGAAAIAGKLHIDQDVWDAAIPVLVLDQGDTSEGTINFIAVDRGVITGATDSVASVRVEVNGVVRRIACYADA